MDCFQVQEHLILMGKKMEKEIESIDSFRIIEKQVIIYSLAYDLGWSMEKDSSTGYIVVKFRKYVGKNNLQSGLTIINPSLSFETDLYYIVSELSYQISKEREIYMRSFDLI